MDYRKKVGTLILTSLLEDLVYHLVCFSVEGLTRPAGTFGPPNDSSLGSLEGRPVMGSQKLVPIAGHVSNGHFVCLCYPFATFQSESRNEHRRHFSGPDPFDSTHMGVPLFLRVRSFGPFSGIPKDQVPLFGLQREAKEDRNLVVFFLRHTHVATDLGSFRHCRLRKGSRRCGACPKSPSAARLFLEPLGWCGFQEPLRFSAAGGHAISSA